MKRFLRPLVIVLFLLLVRNVFAQPVYHILSSDTNFYHWVGTPEEIACAKNVSSMDCKMASWERRPDAPDGTYYIYYGYEKFMNSVYREYPDDTICYEVVNYINGEREGKLTAYYYNENRLLAEEFYSDGKLQNQVIYNRFAHTTPYSHRDPLIKGMFHVTGHYDDPLTIIYHNRFDSLDRNIYASASIVNGSDTALFYEEWETYEDSTIRVLNYNHYIPGDPPTNEVIMTNSYLIFRRWCSDGQLYYHREEKIYRRYDGSREVIETNVILNLLSPADQEKDRWWDYCNTR